MKEIENFSIVEELINNFTEYSTEVNLNRAFPYIVPGLKPVAGHILWSMWVNGRRSNKPYTKSAKVSGEVMSFSEHGDAYGSMARLAADFIYHIPYIDGHGSFGSVIGGPIPASARYTEMRLSEFIEDVLFYNTRLLDMGLNYLEEEEEPKLESWTALLPLLFITNTSGMGYTQSNAWSSGNLFEFQEQLINYLKTGEVDCSKIYPDFPTGGIIINKSEMKDLYETGKGTIRLRGKTEINGDTIRVLSLPYQVYPEQFIDDVKKYIDRNVNTIKDLRNMCGMKGFLIEIDCDKGTAQYTLEELFRKTRLQVNISDEHKAVNENGKVSLISFKEYMESFVNNNIRLVIKEAKLNLEDIDKRLEIVNGLLSALDIIDEIITGIKNAKSKDDAKKWLINRGFTENQSQAIVDMQLGRLANLEQIKLKDEKKELDNKKEFNEKLLSDRKEQEKYFLDRFNKLIDKYAWERKTELAEIKMTRTARSKRVKKPAKLRPKKQYMVVLTTENCLKRISMTRFRQTGEDEKTIKVEGNQRIIMISNKGNMYKVFSNQIDKCLPTASGTPIADIRPEIGDEKIIRIYDEDYDLPYICFVTKKGIGKFGETKNTLGLSRQIGTTVCGLKTDDDEIVAVKVFDEGQNIELITNQRKEMITPNKPQGRGATGKKIIHLKENEEVLDINPV